MNIISPYILLIACKFPGRADDVYVNHLLENTKPVYQLFSSQIMCCYVENNWSQKIYFYLSFQVT